jgi:hypothetical protein
MQMSIQALFPQIHVSVFRIRMPCGLVSGYEHFDGKNFPHLHVIPNREALRFFKLLVIVYDITRRDSPEVCIRIFKDAGEQIVPILFFRLCNRTLCKLVALLSLHVFTHLYIILCKVMYLTMNKVSFRFST